MRFRISENQNPRIPEHEDDLLSEILEFGDSEIPAPKGFSPWERGFLLLALILTLFAAPAAKAQDTTTALAAHWKFDESSGPTAADSSGNGYDASFVSTPTPGIDGKVGSAYSFDLGDHLTVSTTLGSPLSLSFAVWVNFDGYDSAGSTIINIDDKVNLELDDTDQIQGNAFLGGIWERTTYSVSLVGAGWHHIVYTMDHVNDIQRVYLNGLLVSTTNHSADLDYTGATTTYIGKHATTGAYDFDGLIDDLRVYSRALEPKDVAALYAARPGNIRYNTGYRTAEYHDGTQWIAMGPTKYAANAVEFDGTNDYLRLNTALTGAADTKQITGSLWVYYNIDPSVSMTMVRSATGKVQIQYSASADRFTALVRNASGTIIGQFNCGGASPVAGQWYHFMFSFDLSDPLKRHCYLDDVSTYGHVVYTDDLIDTDSDTMWSIGASTDGPATNKLNGAIADLWVDIGTYLDLSVEANRRKFISAAGAPVNLGTDGSLPTGTAPEIFLSGATADWHTNKGTGGGFTENGALTDAASDPGGASADPCDPANSPSAGQACTDGSVYAGLSPDGNAPMYVTAADAGSYTWGTYLTVTGYTSLVTGASNTQNLVANHLNSESGVQAAEACDSLDVHGKSDWYLPARSELAVLYNAGSPVAGISNDASGYWSSSEDSNELAWRYHFDSGAASSSGKFNSRRVRCVRKGYTPECSTPAHPEGTLIYNTTSNVLQYCDGENWNATGPVPGAGGAGCSDPAGALGGVTYNATFNVLQYCDGASWIAVGKPPRPQCSGSPGAGDEGCAMPDGSIYAGQSPDGNVAMYTTPADAGQFTWKKDSNSTDWVDTPMVNCSGSEASCRTGEANTELLAGLSDLVSPYDAAVHCYNLDAHGHQDWYLPSADELTVLKDNKAVIGGFNLSGTYTAGYYWSSSEGSNIDALIWIFGTEIDAYQSKDADFSVRCVRK